MSKETEFLSPEFINFLDENVEFLSKNKMEFQALTEKYINNPKFLKRWFKKIKGDTRTLGISKFEYAINLFPTLISAPSAIFGFLLGLSNLEMFADIFGNFTVLMIALACSILLMACGTIAIYCQLRTKDLQFRFKNWFYLGILFRLLCKENNTNKPNCFSLAPLQTLLKEAARKLSAGKVPDIKEFLEKIKNNKIEDKIKTSAILQLIQDLQEKPPITIYQYFPDSQAKKHKITNKFLLKIKNIWRFFNTNILSNQDIWDMTINNLGMVAGIVGVGLGTIKTSAKFFQHKTLEHTIESTQSAYINIVFIIVLLSLNVYCRLKTRKTNARYEKIGCQQSQFILKITELRFFLDTQ